jgi:hypothetical protein
MAGRMKRPEDPAGAGNALVCHCAAQAVGTYQRDA